MGFSSRNNKAVKKTKFKTLGEKRTEIKVISDT